jgi:serine/threonine protein kinase
MSRSDHHGIDGLLEAFRTEFPRYTRVATPDPVILGSSAVFRDTNTSMQYSVKFLSTDHLESVNHLKSAQHLAVLSLSHVHRLRTPPSMALLTAFMRRGSLASVLRDARLGTASSPLDSTQRYLAAIGIAAGMEYLHRQDIVHGNLTPSNVLLDDRFCPLITDFGLARWSAPRPRSPPLLAFTAPETFANGTHSRMADVYAYGFVLYELLTGLEPWADVHSPAELAAKVGNGERPPLPLPPALPEHAGNLIRLCWQQNPQGRPPFADVFATMLSGEFAFPADVDVGRLWVYALRVIPPQFLSSGCLSSAFVVSVVDYLATENERVHTRLATLEKETDVLREDERRLRNRLSVHRRRNTTD